MSHEAMTQAAHAHAKEILRDQYKTNPDAVESILHSFTEGWKAATSTSFTREQVIKIIDDMLQSPDILLDACNNEMTDHDSQTLLEMFEE